MKTYAPILTKIAIITSLMTLPLLATSTVDYKSKADNLVKVGSLAAGFADASKSKLPETEIKAKFESYGEEVTTAALKWASDEELSGAPPAFRRFLMFDYLTKNSDIIAAASNPENLIINYDASVEIIFESHPEIKTWAQKQMDAVITEPQYKEIGNYFVTAQPMIPPQAKAEACIACHASAEVGRPYPEGQKVLGYTFVAIPKS